MTQAMFWSSEVENPLKLGCLKIDNLGYHTVPISRNATEKWTERSKNELVKNHRDPASPALVFDAPLVKTGTPTQQRQFSESVFDLATTALKNILNVNLKDIYLNTVVTLKKVIVCLPEESQLSGKSYKSFSKFSAVQPGFSGTFLLQIPVEGGCTGASLNILNQDETIEQLDLTKNSCTHAYMTLLLNSSSSSPLHYEITPPSSGAVVMMVFHLVWQDCHKLTSKLSTLAPFIDFTGKILSSMSKARKSSFSTLFYIPLPQVSASDNPDTFRFKGDSSDVAFAVSSLKHYDILGIVSETQSRDSNGKPDSIFIHRIINPGNSFLTPIEWIGTNIQVTHIDAREIHDDVTEIIEETTQTFGALIIPRKELLFRSCSNDLLRVIQTIEERFLKLDQSAIACRIQSQLIYDLRIIADYLVEQNFFPEDETSIAGVKTLLECFVKLKLVDPCADILKSIISELCRKVQNDSTPWKDLIELVFIFSRRIGRRELALTMEHLMSPSFQNIEDFTREDVLEEIVDKLHSSCLPIEASPNQFSAEQIDSIIDSLQDIEPSATVVRNPEALGKIGQFFRPFNTKQMAHVLLNYRARHARIHERFPRLMGAVMQEASRTGFFKCLENDAKIVDDLLQLYIDSGDIGSIARVLVRTTFTKAFSDAKFDRLRQILMYSINNWADLKAFASAGVSDSFGAGFAKSAFNKFLSWFASSNEKQGKGKSKKQKKQNERGTRDLWTTMDEHQFVVRFFAFGLFHRDRSGSVTPPAIPSRNAELLDLANDNHRCLLFSSLVKWDENGLKSDKDVLSLVTELFHAYVIRYPAKAATLYNSDTWLNIGNCVAWQTDKNFPETIIKEVIKLFKGDNKKMQPKLDSTKIIKGIMESNLCLGGAEAKKPIVNERFIDELLELWIQLLSKQADTRAAVQPGYVRNGIISCITSFFRARKLNLYMPRTSPHVQLLHKIAKLLNLDNLITMFENVLKIEVDPVRPVTKAVDAISWRLYVTMCTWIVSSPELEPFLKSCDVKKAATLYGFALWCGNQRLLDVLNEKIFSLPPLETGGTLREMLVDMPHVKRLAVDACSKEALKKLNPIVVPPVSEANKEEKESPEKRKLPEDSMEQESLFDGACVAKKIKIEKNTEEKDVAVDSLGKAAPSEEESVHIKTEPVS